MVNYPLASSTWDNAEIIAIREVIASGMFTMNRHVALFEEALARFLGCKYCVMVNSGSSANLLSVAALFYRRDRPLQHGDEVVVPSVSWATTYYPLYQYGLRLKFVDIDAQTLNYDLGRLADAVTNQTRMIVVVNLLGNPNDFSAIRQIVGHRDVVILEDNCESLGAVYDAKHTGTFGIMGTFSFFFSHHISTMEGGMVATDDEELYHILLSLRAHGWTRNLPRHNRVCADRTDDPFSELFRFVLPGFNVRPLELSGAVGVEQLKKLPEFIRVRRENAQIFQKLMKNYPYFDIQKELGQSSWFGFSLVIKKEAPFSRNQVLQKLDEKRIEYRPIVAGNFAQTEVMKWLDYTIHGELDNANHITQNGFFVGNHHYPLQQQLALLAEAIGDFRS